MRRSHSSDTEGASAPVVDTARVFRWLMPYFWANAGRFVLAFVCLALAKLATVAVPVALKHIVDAVTGGHASSSLVDATRATTDSLSALLHSQGALLFGLVLIYGALRFSSTLMAELRELLFVRVTQQAVRTIALQVFTHLQALSLRFHLDRQTGGMMRDIERGTRGISSLVSYALYSIFPTFVEISLVAAYMAWHYDASFLWTTLIALVVYVFFTVRVTEWRTHFRRAMNDLDSKANQRAVDALINYETVKYFGNEMYEQQRYDHSLAAYEAAVLRSQRSLSLLNIGQSAIIAAAASAILWQAVQGVVSGEMSLGDLVLVNALMIQLYAPLNFLGVIYREIKQATIDVSRLFVLLQQDVEVRDAPDAMECEANEITVEFRHVCFTYGDRQILDDVSFSIPAGKTVALVGPSGAGKSTIARLLFRFFDVSSGEILINGQDIRHYRQASLRRHIGIVPQDTVLFNDSIAANVGYGNVSASDDAIDQVTRRANLSTLIDELPQGYATVVGERGLKLSGGEKQRVAIARTLLKNPPLLIFDEATSSLDSQAEQQIVSALSDLAQQKTTLVIAHRLSTVVNADQIVVLEHGRVVEVGNHLELLQRSGLYARLWGASGTSQQVEGHGMN